MEESHIEDKFKECKNDVLEILNIFKFNKIQPENKTKSFNKFNSVIQGKSYNKIFIKNYNKFIHIYKKK